MAGVSRIEGSMEVVREAYCPMLENILGNSSFYVPTAIGKSDSLLVNIDHGSKTDNRILKGNTMADPANAPGTASSPPPPRSARLPHRLPRKTPSASSHQQGRRSR